MLATKNGAHAETTYEVFESIDTKTRNCELSWASDGDNHNWLEDASGAKQGYSFEEYSLSEMTEWTGSQPEMFLRTFVDDV